jgi:hypothetical protein
MSTKQYIQNNLSFFYKSNYSTQFQKRIAFLLIKMDNSKPTVKNRYDCKLIKYILEENYEL